MLFNRDRTAFLNDRANQKADSLLKPFQNPETLRLSRAEQANLQRQREKLSQIKANLKKEIQKEKKRNLNIKKFKQRVSQIESRNIKKRRDLLKFFKNIRDGDPDEVLRQVDGLEDFEDPDQNYNKDDNRQENYNNFGKSRGLKVETKFIERAGEDEVEKGDVFKFDWRADLNQCVNVHEMENIMNPENRAIDIEHSSWFDLGNDHYNR